MEVIIALLMGFVFGFWRGVMSGYRTGSKEKSKIYNVELEEIDGEFHFRELPGHQFIIKDSSIEKGTQHIYDSLPEGHILVISRP
jgi:hypothetical protein